MKIKELLNLDLGDEITVVNEPFVFIGKMEIELEGGAKQFWLFDENDALLSIAEESEETTYFQPDEAEIQPDDEVILFRNKEYELSYEDSGQVTDSDGDLISEVEDFMSFVDFQSDTGNTLRVLLNETTDERLTYIGQVVVPEEILEVE